MADSWEGNERRKFQVPSWAGNYPGNLIQFFKDNIDRYPAFLDDLHEPKDKRGVIFALDIRNFTKTMKDNDAKRVQSFLSLFFDTAVERIQSHSGSYVNKFLGDGLLGHFLERHESEAIDVADDIIRVFTGMKSQYNFPFCNLSVALSKADHIETTVGQHNYVDYTILGAEINALFRLLSSAEGKLCYVTSNYTDKLNRSHWYTFVGVKKFKGIIEPIPCYSVIRQKSKAEKQSGVASMCSQESCYAPSVYETCHKAWVSGHKAINTKTESDYLFALNCDSCTTSHRCWYWGNCAPKYTNAKEDKNTECCHVCSNFRNCFHNYQLGRQGKNMITCSSELLELSLQ